MRRLCRRRLLAAEATLVAAFLCVGSAHAAPASIPSGTTTVVSGTSQSYGSGVNIDGTLAISNGGVVNAYDYSAIATVSTNAFLTVSGAGSQFNLNYHDLGVGYANGANATISVTDGGSVSLFSNFNASNAAGSATTIIVDGAGSTFTSGFQLGLGSAAGSVANVTISNGGTLYAQEQQCCDRNGEGVVFIGVNGTANVKVTGTGSSLMSDWSTLWVGSIPGAGSTGAGTLTLSNGGNVDVASGNGTIELAYQSGSTGTLAIGSAAGQAPTAPGIVDASQISFGSGTGQLVFNHTSDSYVFAPQISGPGSVLVENGTTILTNSNSYTGTTTLAGGILGLGSAAALGSGPISFEGGTLQYGAANQVDYSAQFSTAPGQLYSIDTNGQAVTFATGLASAGGSLTKLGDGTLTLTGANSYTGITDVVAGTLLGGAADTFSAASATTVGSGGILDLGSVPQTINSVTLGGGTLQNGALAGAVTSNGGTIDALAGSASLTLTSGTTTALGANTYTGATTIVAGTLLGGGANTLSAVSATTVGSGGVLDLGDVPQTINAVALAGGTLQNGALTGAVTSTGGAIDDLGGSASLTLTGGTTTALGVNTYSGATTINGGTLDVVGSVTASNIVVNAGGTLSGVGKIGDPIIAAGGTLAPGNATNPTGTLTIVGPLGFAAGSFYNVAITPSASGVTKVVGTTTISGGTVNVAAGNGVYSVNKKYTILTSSGGVNGSFATAAATNLAFLAPKLSYDAGDVFVTLVQANAFRTAAATQAQGAVAGALDAAAQTVAPGSNGAKLIGALDQLTGAQAKAAFDGLSGEGIAAAQNVAFRSAQLFTSSIFDQTTFYGSGSAANSITLTEPAPGQVALAARQGQAIRELADLPSSTVAPVFVAPARTWRAWATGFGGTEDIHGNAAIGSVAQSNDLYGGALGIDYQMVPSFLVGVAVGGSSGDFQVDQRATSGTTTGGHVALYDLATYGAFYGASSISFSDFDNKTNRMIAGFGGLTAETLRGHFNSNEVRGRFELGRHYAGVSGTITPFVAIEAAGLSSGGFRETTINGSSLLGLAVPGQSASDAPGFVGLRYQTVMPLGGLTVLPSLQVAYEHEFAPYRQETAAIADLPGSTFLVDGARPARNAAQVKAGGEVRIGPNSSLFVNFDGELSSVNQLYAGKGGFKYVW